VKRFLLVDTLIIEISTSAILGYAVPRTPATDKLIVHVINSKWYVCSLFRVFHPTTFDWFVWVAV